MLTEFQWQVLQLPRGQRYFKNRVFFLLMKAFVCVTASAESFPCNIKLWCAVEHTKTTQETWILKKSLLLSRLISVLDHT